MMTTYDSAQYDIEDMSSARSDIMKKLIMTVLLMMAMSLGAQAETYIGLFDNMECTSCYGETVLHGTKAVYVYAWLDPEVESVTGVEFSILNLPENGLGGMVTPLWWADSTTGDVVNGLSLTFSTPLEGPLAFLGMINFTPQDPSWIMQNHVMTVREAQGSGKLTLVDQDFVTVDVEGGSFTFNCAQPQDCGCLGSVPTNEINWSSIKALY
jgi:hypothetical protein